MMSSPDYGIGVVKNRFALNGIEEEVDPLELIEQSRLEREAKKKTKINNKLTQTLKPKSQKVPAEIMKKKVSTIENNYQNSHGNDGESAVLESTVERYSRRGRGVFVRGGGRGRSTVDSRGKREFDRQSGSDRTGIKSIDKRDGSGSHNWGNPRDDIDNLPISFSTEERKVNEKPRGEDKINETVTEEEVEKCLNVIQDDKQKKKLTLDEWKAMKTPRKQPTYNIRKAGEGEDLSQWKKMYALEKKKENEEEYEYEFGDFPQRVGRQKVVDINIHFKEGRGFMRGGLRSQGGHNTQFPRQNVKVSNPPMIPAPKVDDEKDFPSLV